MSKNSYLFSYFSVTVFGWLAMVKTSFSERFQNLIVPAGKAGRHLRMTKAATRHSILP
jgi:hypothetical protein